PQLVLGDALHRSPSRRLDDDDAIAHLGGSVTPLTASFFFNGLPSPAIYTLSLHDALPISSVCRMTFPILASLLVRLVVLLPFQLLRLSLATPSRWTPLALSVFLHCVVALLLTLL